MPAKRGFFVVFLAVLALSVLSIPHRAYASVDAAGITSCSNDGNDPADVGFQHAAAAAGQQATQDATKAWEGFQKIDAAGSQCIDQLMSIYNAFVSSTASLTDPLGIITSILSSQITGLVNQVCSQVVGTIGGAGNSLSSLTRMCLPLPTFGIGGWNLGLNMPGCSGGTQISPISFGSGGAQGSTFQIPFSDVSNFIGKQ
ncbi:MAG: hypothetical protein KGI97_04235 [Alphaproteobacteria bacterium]|nr:hypothetical protein [Alphaproteobacteria bacterium]